MDKKAVIDFFDRRAARWDAEMIKHEDIVELILDNAGVSEGDRVLDVACGTGVLMDNYLKRQVSHVTGIDISPEMARIAAGKFTDPRVEIICGDVESEPLPDSYDRIVVYNAFPHFPRPEALISRLSSLLSPGGTLTVAHGMSRSCIDDHHKGCASQVSVGLMSEDELSAIFSRHLRVTVCISDERMYQVCGVRE